MPEMTFGDEIGRGGFCRVHHISFSEDGQPLESAAPLVAKRLRDDLTEPVETLKEIRTRFEREARLLDEILDHPNIVRVYYRNLSGDQPYYIMPYADSTVAHELPSKAGDETWVANIFRQILEGMAYAHGKGVIHRDLKPENVLLFDGEIAALSDFGLGKNLSGGTIGLTRTAHWSGTEPYMAPEQFTSMNQTGTTADVFSLGKLLMAMLSGTAPEVGSPDVSELPEKYRYFVSRCCERRSENRFQDAREALAGFDRAQAAVVFAQPPTESLLDLVESWFTTPDDADRAVLERIDEHLRSHPTEEAMYTKEVPKLPDQLVDQYMDQLPAGFLSMLEIYDGHVSGGLPFEYCDVVADFYERIYRRTDRLDLRRLILARLILLGYSHNRFYVRERTLAVLESANSPSTVEMTADVLRQEPRAAIWNGEEAGDRQFAQPIALALGL
jgi:eukaryotic-like serine/threonine-protein kinase